MYISTKTKKIIAVVAIILFLALILAGTLWGIFFSKEKYYPTQYTMDIDIKPDTFQVSIKEKIVYFNQSNAPLKEIWLNFYPNAFNDKTKMLLCSVDELRSAYPYGINYGKATFHSIICENIEKWTFDTKENLVKIQLAIPLKESEKITINADYVLTLPVTTLRYGINESAIMLSNFYLQVPPITNSKWQVWDYFSIGDPFYNECSDYFVSYQLPEGYCSVNSGSYTEFSKQKSKYVFAESKNTRDFAIVLSKLANKKTSTVNGVDISYLYTFDLSPDKTFEQIKTALSVFSTLYGEYSHSSFSVAKIPFVAGGMEFGSLIYISDLLSGENQENVIAHETAHQWWYGMVGTNPIYQPWLDEGLTQFSVYQYYLQTNNPLAAAKYITSAKDEYSNYLKTKASVGEPVDKKEFYLPLDCYKHNFDYVNICYNKSLLLWNDAQNFMTNKKLNKALSQILETYRYKIVNSQIVFDYLDKNKNRTSEHLQSWIENF